MSSKRKTPSLGLERRVRARREEQWEPEPESDVDSEDDSPVEESALNRDGDDVEESDQEPSEEQSSDDDQETPPKIDLSSVSFGALARAQASLAQPGRKSKENKDENEKSQAGGEEPWWAHKKDTKPHVKRSSKHAPQEQTSKRPVRRMREIIPDTRRKARDPRFDPLVGKVDESKSRKAYAFLDDYRASEMADLRTQIKKTKNADEKESLKRQLLSMESRKKARDKKDEGDRLLQEHRQKEKDLVAQGKQPFYLKKSEQKKQLLTNRFESMSKGQVDKAIERKRKKVAGKEKKELGSLMRVRDR